MPIMSLQRNVKEIVDSLHSTPASLGKRPSDLLSISPGNVFFGPRADPQLNQIQFSESFLSSLWAVIYGLLVTGDGGTYTSTASLTATDVQKASQMLDWGFSLPRKISPWPNGLPVPNTRRQYVEVANEIFTYSFSYLYFHELCHLKNHHTNAIIPKSENMIQQTINTMVETEADNESLEILLNGREEDEDIYRFVAGAMFAILSQLVLFKPDTIIQENHPDTDERLYRILEIAKNACPSKYELLCFSSVHAIASFWSYNFQDDSCKESFLKSSETNIQAALDCYFQAINDFKQDRRNEIRRSKERM